jgi:cyclopropane-fatty-acyl-phospholipid synthase
VALYDERFFRLWTFYLAGAATVFEHGGMVNFQVQYARDRRTLPITRDYMHDTEARLKGR